MRHQNDQDGQREVRHLAGLRRRGRTLVFRGHAQEDSGGCLLRSVPFASAPSHLRGCLVVTGSIRVVGIGDHAVGGGCFRAGRLVWGLDFRGHRRPGALVALLPRLHRPCSSPPPSPRPPQRPGPPTHRPASGLLCGGGRWSATRLRGGSSGREQPRRIRSKKAARVAGRGRGGRGRQLLHAARVSIALGSS